MRGSRLFYGHAGLVSVRTCHRARGIRRAGLSLLLKEQHLLPPELVPTIYRAAPFQKMRDRHSARSPPLGFVAGHFLDQARDVPIYWER
jgi:hypothetical protein